MYVSLCALNVNEVLLKQAAVLRWFVFFCSVHETVHFPDIEIEHPCCFPLPQKIRGDSKIVAGAWKTAVGFSTINSIHCGSFTTAKDWVLEPERWRTAITSKMVCSFCTWFHFLDVCIHKFVYKSPLGALAASAVVFALVASVSVETPRREACGFWVLVFVFVFEKNFLLMPSFSQLSSVAERCPRHPQPSFLGVVELFCCCFLGRNRSPWKDGNATMIHEENERAIGGKKHGSIKNWIGPCQRTDPKANARAIRYSGLGVRSVGPVGDFLD